MVVKQQPMAIQHNTETSTSNSQQSSHGDRDSNQATAATSQEEEQQQEEQVEEEEPWWRYLPVGAEAIVRQIAAERILHELLDKVNDRGKVEHWAIANIAREFPGTCLMPFSVRWEDGGTRTLTPLAVLCCLQPPLDAVKAVFDANPKAIFVREPYKRALPLHLASAFEASLEVVQFVYSKNKEAISIPRNDGVYPVHLASGFYLGNPSVVNFLLDEYPEGASKICTIVSWSPLHSAAHGGVPDVSLLQRLHAMDSSMIEERDKHGRCALHLACRSLHGNAQAVDFLARSFPAALNVGDRGESWTPLFLACVHQQPDVIEAVLRWTNLRNVAMADARTGATLLHWATLYNSAETVEFLAQRFPSLLSTQTTDSSRQTPLAWGVENNAPLDNLEVLIQHYPLALFVRNGRGERPLAVLNGRGRARPERPSSRNRRRKSRTDDIVLLLRESEDRYRDDFRSLASEFN